MHVKYFCSTHTPTHYIHLLSAIRSVVAEISQYRETKHGNKTLNYLFDCNLNKTPYLEVFTGQQYSYISYCWYKVLVNVYVVQAITVAIRTQSKNYKSVHVIFSWFRKYILLHQVSGSPLQLCFFILIFKDSCTLDLQFRFCFSDFSAGEEK